MSYDWHHLNEQPLPIGRVVLGRKADGTVIVGRTGAKPTNALTDRNGNRHVVYHWRQIQATRAGRAAARASD